MKKLATTLLLFTLLAAAPAYGADVALRIGKHPIRAEVADTLPAQRRGLMFRKQLCENCGMLFVFATPARYGFWMKNTLLPLSAAFIGADGRIINIADMQPNTEALHYPAADAQYVLEMGRGWFDAHGIKPGDSVQGLPWAVVSGDGANR